MRLLITGGPSTGKTTAADSIGIESGCIVRHTDDLIATLDWSACSLEVSKWFDESGSFVIEGVAVPRALRKWLANNPTGKPADKIVVMSKPFSELSRGQIAMTKGLHTVWQEILPLLLERGVTIEQR